MPGSPSSQHLCRQDCCMHYSTLHPCEECKLLLQSNYFLWKRQKVTLETNIPNNKQAQIQAELKLNLNCYFILEGLGGRLPQTHLPKQFPYLFPRVFPIGEHTEQILVRFPDTAIGSMSSWVCSSKQTTVTAKWHSKETIHDKA